MFLGVSGICIDYLTCAAPGYVNRNVVTRSVFVNDLFDSANLARIKTDLYAVRVAR